MAEMIPFEEKDKDDSQSSQNQTELDSSESRGDGRPVYTNEEVSEIIRVALRDVDSSRENTVDYNEMLAIGRDFGLTERDLEGAFDAISKKRSEKEQYATVNLWLKVHALTYGVIMLGLFGINMATTPDYLWIIFPVLGWGMALVLHGILTHYFPSLMVMMLDVESSTEADEISSTAAFTISDLYGNMAKASGVALIQDDDLLIEYETKDTVLGIIKSGVKELHIPLSDIASARLSRQFWSTKLTLQSHRLKSFEDFPGHTSGKVELVFDRQTRAASERLAADIARRIAQR